MIALRPAATRGHTQLSWLDSRHTFSFGDYYDPANDSFRSLRVLNDDRIAPRGGFGMHPHRDFEIISYVASGAIEHKDSLGTGSVIRPGEVQRMTAGTGILHSEFNPLATEPTHLLQIWLTPERRGLRPSYEQKLFAIDQRRNRWQLLASRDGRDGSVIVHQDAELWGIVLDAGATATHRIAPGRGAWVQVVRGAAQINGRPIVGGDGAGITDETELTVTATDEAELLVFDLA